MAASATASRPTNCAPERMSSPPLPDACWIISNKARCGSTRWNFSSSTKRIGCWTWVFFPTCAGDLGRDNAHLGRAEHRIASAGDVAACGVDRNMLVAEPDAGANLDLQRQLGLE